MLFLVMVLFTLMLCIMIWYVLNILVEQGATWITTIAMGLLAWTLAGLPAWLISILKLRKIVKGVKAEMNDQQEGPEINTKKGADGTYETV